MENERFDFYRQTTQIISRALLIAALGMSNSARAEEPFCKADDLCVEVKGRVTGYVPNAPNAVETGQCIEPCHITTSGNPVIYGVTAACPAGVPFGVQVHIKDTISPSKAEGNIYTCHDTGDLGAVGDPEAIVDIAVDYYTDDPDLYTSRSTLVFKYGKRLTNNTLNEVELERYTYKPQPKDLSIQVPTLSR